MSTAHKFIYFEKAIGGMSPGTPPHLITPTQWLNSLNFRFVNDSVVSFDGTVPLRLGFDLTEPVNTIIVAPQAGGISSLILLDSSNLPKVFYRNLDVYSEFSSVSITGRSLTLASNSNWVYVVRQDGVYFTNPNCTITKLTPEGMSELVDTVTGRTIMTDGSTYIDPAVVVQSPYSAKFIEVFYDHLVVANLNNSQYPGRVAWSDIDNYAVFTPTQQNEADFYDVNANSSNFSSLDITGLKQLQNIMYVYTDHSIWSMSYIGLPGVMQTQEVFSGGGCSYPYSMVAVENKHYFFGREDIYTWDGVHLEAIGDPVKEMIFGDLQADFQSALVRGYVNPDTTEIVWDYPSAKYNGRIMTVVYNYRKAVWYVLGLQGKATQHQGYFTTGFVADMLQGTCNLLSGTCDELVQAKRWNSPLYATKDGDETPILSRPTLSNESGLAQGPEAPYLESGDIYFEDAQAVKEIDTVILDAACDDIFGGATGFKVSIYVSTRNYLTSPVVYNKVGTTDLKESELRCSFPRISGRIFRVKFVFENDNGGCVAPRLRFVAFGVNVYGVAEER